MNQTKQIKVLINSIPLPGHYIPLLRLTTTLSTHPQLSLYFSTSSHQLPKITLPKSTTPVPLDDPNKSSKQNSEWTYIPCYYYDQPWQSQLVQFIQKQKPDVIVCDFFSSAAIKLGRKYGLPVVIHVPGQTGVLGLLDLPLFRRCFSVFGVTVVENFVHKVFPKVIQPFTELGPYFDTSLVLVSSFFGLDDATSLPPNIKLIGSTFPTHSKIPQSLSPSLSLSSSFSPFSPSLQSFLTTTTTQKKPLIYISFGSAITLSQQFINHLYEGLKKLNYGVIWSLKKGQLPEKNQNFYVDTWVPQLEVLGLREVVAVVMHCGWGGVMECVKYEKPMLCVPVSADQPHNAELVQKRGIGLILRPNKSLLQLTPTPLSTPNFTHTTLQQYLTQLTTNPTYKTNLKKLNQLLSETGGAEQAVRLIKNAAVNGVGHLVDRQIGVIRGRSVWGLVGMVGLVILVVVGLVGLVGMVGMVGRGIGWNGGDL